MAPVATPYRAGGRTGGLEWETEVRKCNQGREGRRLPRSPVHEGRRDGGREGGVGRPEVVIVSGAQTQHFENKKKG